VASSSSFNNNPNIGYRYPYDEDDGNDVDTDGKLKQSTNIKGECARYAMCAPSIWFSIHIPFEIGCLNVHTASASLLCGESSSPPDFQLISLLIKMKFHPLASLFNAHLFPSTNMICFRFLLPFSHAYDVVKMFGVVLLELTTDFLSPLFGAGSASSLNTGKSSKHQSSSPYIVMLAVITSMLVFSYHSKFDIILRTTTTSSS